MKIGILGAMPEEVKRLGLEMHHVERIKVGSREFWTGSLFGIQSVTAFSRWGKVAAASTATTMIDRFGADLIVFTGVAGAADDKLAIGDIVVADSLIQHDVDASASGLFERFELPLLGVKTIQADSRLVSLAIAAVKTFIRDELPYEMETFGKAGMQRLPQVYSGTIASGDKFIADPAYIAELRNSIPGLLALEMEGAAVGQVCYEFGVPLLVIRAISDKADHAAALDFPKFVEHIASLYSWGIVKQVVAELVNSNHPILI